MPVAGMNAGLGETGFCCSSVGTNEADWNAHEALVPLTVDP